MVIRCMVLLLMVPALAGCAQDRPTLHSQLYTQLQGQTNPGALITRCIDDAIVRLQRNSAQKVRRAVLRVYAWPQVWDNTSLGMGGAGFQAVTIAQTVVVFDPVSHRAMEYRNGKFAKLYVMVTDAHLPQVIW